MGNLTHKQSKTQGVNVPREAQRAGRVTGSSGQYCAPPSGVGWAGSPEGSACVLGLDGWRKRQWLNGAHAGRRAGEGFQAVGGRPVGKQAVPRGPRVQLSTDPTRQRAAGGQGQLCPMLHGAPCQHRAQRLHIVGAQKDCWKQASRGITFYTVWCPYLREC